MAHNTPPRQNTSNVDDDLVDVRDEVSLISHASGAESAAYDFAPTRARYPTASAGAEKKPILVLGPGATLQVQSEKLDPAYPYWQRVFEAMIAWCIEHNVIREKGSENEVRQLLQRQAWFSLGYQIEAVYLANKTELQSCLTDVLKDITRPSDLQLQLACLPVRGFISTAYDLGIETAYEQIYRRKLTKFYGLPDRRQAQDIYRQEVPFMLKLYGDIEHADSFTPHQRWSQGIVGLYNHILLPPLLSTSRVFFCGFEKNDPDYKYLKCVVEEHSPFEPRTITVSRSKEDQHQDFKDVYLLTHTDEHQPFNSSLHVQSGATVLPEAIIPGHRSYLDNSYLSSSLEWENSDENAQEKLAYNKNGKKQPIELYTVYTEEDRRYFVDLERYVFEVIRAFHNISCHAHEVSRSVEWRRYTHLETASLIFPLVSLSFIASNFWRCEPMVRALARHPEKARIIPILVQPATLWKRTAMGKQLDCLPVNGRAISECSNKQKAYDEIATYITGILDELQFNP